ncbi:MAG: hypothetical protein IKB25_02505 [Lentisphaeria bacterium]|nr:hypothetical protein [Lentisphaeria bacterium]
MKNILPAILIVSACTLCGQVKDKVFSYIPLKENLESASGVKLKTAFYRKSVARTPDFKEAAAGQPRFWKGEVFLEPGGNTMERGTINLLSAKEDPFDKNGAKVQKAEGFTPAAFSFDGKVTLKPVKFNMTKKFLGRDFIFSFYAKGSGVLKFTSEATLVNGNKKAYPAQNIQLTKDWNRYFVQVKGAPKFGPEDLASFTAVLEGKDVAVDAAMLETPCSYFGVCSPTSYVANGAIREADYLRFNGLTPELGLEGAFSFNFTPTSTGNWQTLLSVGKGGWERDNELELNYYTDRWSGFLKISVFRKTKSQFKRVNLKLGQKYHILINYDKESYTIYLDGKKLMTEKIAGVPFKTDSVFLGSRSIQAHSAGLYSNFTIFKKSLTEAEIAELSKAPELK